MVILCKILFLMILFIHLVNFILFLFIIYVLTHDVMGNYVYEGIRCSEPLVFWQMEQPIYYLIIMLM